MAGGLCLAAGIGLWVAAQSVLVGVPLASRAAPPEVDDAYTYIYKAVQLQTCALQDCPALEALRTELKEPAPTSELAWQRYRAYTRAFLVYHPLYSAVLAALHGAGLAWEAAYVWIWRAGPVIFAAAFAYWLAVLWGAGPAAFAMLLLAFHVFPGQGLHYVVPGNLALALAAALWARIASREGDAPWSLAAGVPLLLGMHAAGRLYAAVAIALAWWLSRGARPRALRSALWFSAAWLAAWSALPYVVDRPELRSAADPWPSTRAMLTFPYFTLEKIVESLDAWASPFGSLAVLGALAAAGFAVAPAGRPKARAATAVLLAALLAGSLLHVLPRYPGDLFTRLWIPFAFFFSAAACAALWTAAAAAAAWLSGRADALTLAGWRAPSSAATGVAIVLLATPAAVGAKAAYEGASRMRTALVYMRDRQPFRLEPDQVKTLLDRARPEDGVLYLNEIPLLMYLSHGALKLGASFYPALDEAALRGKRPRFIAGYNPARTAPLTPRGLVRLDAFRGIEIRSAGPAKGSLELRLQNPGPDASVAGVRVPAGTDGWISVPASGARVKLGLPPQSPLLLSGLRWAGQQGSWPWAQRAEVAFLPAEEGREPVALSYDPDALLPPALRGRGAKVLDDRGLTVLLELPGR